MPISVWPFLKDSHKFKFEMFVLEEESDLSDDPNEVSNEVSDVVSDAAPDSEIKSDFLKKNYKLIMKIKFLYYFWSIISSFILLFLSTILIQVQTKAKNFQQDVDFLHFRS